MSEPWRLTNQRISKLYEASKSDTTIIVGSEIRELVGEINALKADNRAQDVALAQLRQQVEAETWEAAAKHLESVCRIADNKGQEEIVQLLAVLASELRRRIPAKPV